ncbi:wax ester/triacylglycerol synthase domain-containing protein [Nonomuraea glycinis]|uniref:wax ester/triacylglycerol synthase domain-containing protein n=1 Tax=Nonomuraea glycinis TaxID=2047744 RepID=UPI0033A8B818
MGCPPPGDKCALLDLAVEVIGEPLAAARPLWSMTLVTGIDGHRIGLIACLHHVLADGIGGLAVLAGLVDGLLLEPSLQPFPRPAPSRRRIAAQAWAGRLRVLAQRLERTAEITRGRKSQAPGAPAELLAGANRLLATLSTSGTGAIAVPHAMACRWTACVTTNGSRRSAASPKANSSASSGVAGLKPSTTGPGSAGTGIGPAPRTMMTGACAWAAT